MPSITALSSSAAAVTDTGRRQQVARPLHVLQPLIAKDLKQAKVAEIEAGLPYYRAAGEKLIEAKAQIEHGSFEDWAKRNFKISARLARYYMLLARTTTDDENGNALPISSLRKFIKQTSTPRNKPKPGTYQSRLDESEKQQKERQAQRDVALKLIERGYHQLAAEFHPDKKGGSSEMMARLNNARDHLRRMVLQ